MKNYSRKENLAYVRNTQNWLQNIKNALDLLLSHLIEDIFFMLDIF